MLSALLFPRKMPAVSVLVDHRASDNDAQAGCRIIFTPGFMPYTIVSPKADGLNDQVVLATVTPPPPSTVSLSHGHRFKALAWPGENSRAGVGP